MVNFLLKIEYKIRGIIVAFRTMRALKLIGKWEALTETIRFVSSAMVDIFYFAILLIVFIFIFAIVGFNLFANKVKLDTDGNKDLINGESPRVNFDNIWYSFLAAFTLQIGDNWSSYFYQYTRFSNAAYVYFPVAIFTLNIIIMNLFVAIMLEKFFCDDQKGAILEEEKRNQEFNERQKRISMYILNKGRYKNRVATLLTALKAYNTILSLGELCKCKHTVNEIITLTGSSLNIFQRTSWLRLFIDKLINNNTFKVISYIFVALNSIILTFNTPLYDHKGTIYKIFEIIKLTSIIFFVVEIFGEIIAKGFAANGPESFMRSPFNIINLISTLSAIATIVHDGYPFAVKYVLDLFQVLRVLRFLSMNKAFRLRITAIIYGLPK